MSKFRRVLLALFLITLVSSEVMAKTIVDTTKSNKTKVKEMNGTTVIDIDTPNSKGVSVNYFKHFDVEKNGTVLNNSNSDYVTSKGLKISKNENLSSNEAKVALLKVNGTEKSALKGLLEAASGSELDVYISNENGLVVDGLTLENIRKAVLTTGKIDDNLNITVEKGDIRITKNGLSGSKFIDLLTVKLINEGKIKANDEVRVILGSNNNDAKVDASKLGSMYSNKITISSPNKFLNVDTHELLSKESTNIDIQGELTNKGTIASEKNVTIKAKNISNEGKVDFSKGGYEIKWITPDGKVFSLEDINNKWKKKYHKSLTPSDTFLANAGKTLSGFVYDINFTKKNVRQGASLYDKFNAVLDELDKEDKYTLLSREERQELRNKQIDSGFVNKGDFYTTEAGGKKVLEAFAVSKTKADQAKILGENVNLEAKENVVNKDALILGKDKVSIKAKKFENKNTLSNEIELKDGYENVSWKADIDKINHSRQYYMLKYDIDYERDLRTDSKTRKTKIAAVNKSLVSGNNVSINAENVNLSDEKNTGISLKGKNIQVTSKNFNINGQNIEASNINITTDKANLSNAGVYSDKVSIKAKDMSILSKKETEILFDRGKESMQKENILGSIIQSNKDIDLSVDNLKLKGSIIQSKDGKVHLKGNDFNLEAENISKTYNANYDIPETFRKIKNHEKLEQAVGSFVSGKDIKIEYKKTNTKGSGLLANNININANKVNINTANIKHELDRRIGVDNGILGVNYNKIKKQENMSIGSIILSKGDVSTKVDQEFNLIGSKIKGKKINIEGTSINISGKTDTTTTDTASRHLLAGDLQGSYSGGVQKNDISANVEMEVYKKTKGHKVEESNNKSQIQGEDVNINATKKTKIEGSDVEGNNVNIHGENVEITSKKTTNTEHNESEIHKVKVNASVNLGKDGISANSNNEYSVEHKTTNSVETTENGSNIKGKNISITADNKVKIEGSNVEGKESVKIKGKNGVEINSKTEVKKYEAAVQLCKLVLNAKFKEKTLGIVGTIKELVDERDNITKYLLNIPGAIKKYKDVKKTLKENTESIKKAIANIKANGVDPMTLGISVDLEGMISYKPEYINALYTSIKESTISAKEVEISSNKDVNINGSKVKGNKVSIEAENLNIKGSNIVEKTNKTEGNVSVGGKYNIVTNETSGSVGVSATTSGTKKVTNAKSEITANEVNITTKKDMNVQGSKVEANSGQINVGKDLNIKHQTDKKTEYTANVNGTYNPNDNSGTVSANLNVTHESKKQETVIKVNNISVNGKKNETSETEVNVKVEGNVAVDAKKDGTTANGNVGASTKLKGDHGNGEIGLNLGGQVDKDGKLVNPKLESHSKGQVNVGNTTINVENSITGSKDGITTNTNASGNTNISLDAKHAKGNVNIGFGGNLSSNEKGKIDANGNFNTNGEVTIKGQKGNVNGEVTLAGKMDITKGTNKPTVASVEADGKGHVTVQGENKHIKGNVTISADGKFGADNTNGVNKLEGNANTNGTATIKGQNSIVNGEVTLNANSNVSAGKGKKTTASVDADGKGHANINVQVGNVSATANVSAQGSVSASTNKPVKTNVTANVSKPKVTVSKPKVNNVKPKKLKDKVDMKEIRRNVLSRFRRRHR